MKRRCCCTTAVVPLCCCCVVLLYRCCRCSVYRGCAVFFCVSRQVWNLCIASKGVHREHSYTRWYGSKLLYVNFVWKLKPCCCTFAIGFFLTTDTTVLRQTLVHSRGRVIDQVQRILRENKYQVPGILLIHFLPFGTADRRSIFFSPHRWLVAATMAMANKAQHPERDHEC